MTTELDRRFATALRAALVDEVRTTERTDRRRWIRIGTVGLLSVAVVGGGVAFAAHHLRPFRGTEVEYRTGEITATRTGTAAVDLGPRPEGVDEVALRIVCLTPGTFEVSRGDGMTSGMTCGQADVGASDTSEQVVKLGPGEHSVTVTTAAGARWRLIARYVVVHPEQWGINADGKTYGSAAGNGVPDLVGVWATNSRSGYAYAWQLDQPMPSTPEEALRWQSGPQITEYIPVYESDGKTVIGQFETHRPALAPPPDPNRKPVEPTMPRPAPLPPRAVEP